LVGGVRPSRGDRGRSSESCRRYPGDPRKRNGGRWFAPRNLVLTRNGLRDGASPELQLTKRAARRDQLPSTGFDPPLSLIQTPSGDSTHPPRVGGSHDTWVRAGHAATAAKRMKIPTCPHSVASLFPSRNALIRVPQATLPRENGLSGARDARSRIRRPRTTGYKNIPHDRLFLRCSTRHSNDRCDSRAGDHATPKRASRRVPGITGAPSAEGASRAGDGSEREARRESGSPDRPSEPTPMTARPSADRTP